MSFLPLTLERLERASTQLLDTLAARPRLAAAALLVLAVFTYLPGVFLLPPVDRTEIVYAQSSRGMLERGTAIDSSYEGERFAFRPIGIYWLQAGAGKFLGRWAWDDIATYRLPSLLAGILAVLATWWLTRPLLGDRRAAIAAGLFAVSPIVALQATLSIPEGPLLLAIVVAQLTLMRLYCAPASDRDKQLWLALAFWAAQGGGMLLNALAVPILSLATLIALYVMDRRLDWLSRLRPLIGIPLMLGIAAPWLLIRAHFDGGVPFSGLTWGEFIRALGGAQDMKWKAAPLTFTLAFLLGFLPGAVLLWPALQNLWRERSDALQRFLFAWIVGYWLYLELIASKPALYTVQAMFPAAAAAVALVLDREGKLTLPPYMLRLPPWLVLGGTIVLFAVLTNLAQVRTGFLIVGGAVAIAVLFTYAAQAAKGGLAAAWIIFSIAGFALFITYTFAVLMPSAEIGWPAPRIAEAVAPLRRCVIGPVGVVGFREPSTTFVLGRDANASVDTLAGWMAGGSDGIAVVEDRWQPDLAKALAARGAKAPPRLGCVEAFNVMRGCPLDFSIYATGRDVLDPGCKVAEEFACSIPMPLLAEDTDPKSRCR
ncbi:MAG: glycosyltransferase family 39 protein [Hyphomicrobium sp.]|nr:glycosyltransferase family 39 protein [Hyphomicrobium sp.]